MAITHQETQINGALDVTSLASNSVQGGTNQMYVCFISRRSNLSISTLTDSSGMTWTLVRDASGGRNQTGSSMYVAYGSPGAAFTVTVTFGATCLSVVIAVSRYDGVDSTTPYADTEVHFANTLGQDVSATGSGVDNTAANLTISSSVNGCMIVNGTIPRSKNVSIADANYTYRGDLLQSSSVAGNETHHYTYDRMMTTAGSANKADTTSSACDWVEIGIVLRPASGTTVNVSSARIGITEFLVTIKRKSSD